MATSMAITTSRRMDRHVSQVVNNQAFILPIINFIGSGLISIREW